MGLSLELHTLLFKVPRVVETQRLLFFLSSHVILTITLQGEHYYLPLKYEETRVSVMAQRKRI